MRNARVWTLLTVALAVGFAVEAAGSIRAQSAPGVALAGTVRSAAEGAMEGVLVSARRTGSSMTVTVVSGADGRYAFPASHLAPGAYGLAIRAVGYDLASDAHVTVPAGTAATADLTLTPTAHLEDQMSNAEWMVSMPGTYEQKHQLLDCTGCHTLQRVVDSYHTEADFRANVLPRMENYANQSFWLKPQPYRSARTGRSAWPDGLAAYLATINQSAGPRTWALKPFPRLTGASTHVIITQYDLPNRLTQPHDVMGTPDGTIWFSDFGQQFLGRLDPKTGAVTEIPVPELKPGYLTGALELEADANGDLWLANLYQGGVTRYDPRTNAFKQWRVAPAQHPEYTQESMVFPIHMGVDGKVWTNNQDDHSLRRLDPATGTWDVYGPFTYPGDPKKTFNSYGIVSDAANTPWLFDFSHAAIGHFDPKTGVMKIIPTPTAFSRPRRGRVDDATGMFWFAEYGANRIGAYDIKADNGTIKEYPLPTPWDSPYDVVADKNGEVWAGSMWSDRISRLNPATGTIVEYQLPTETNIRRVWVDNRTNPVTFWTGSNHGAAIVKLELE
jgi:virginiamycin B lyase